MQLNTQQTVSTKKSKRGKSLAILAIILLMIAVCSSYYYDLFIVGQQTTEDAYVDGNLVQIAPKISGTVTQINVDDGDYVEQGQHLVQLDDADTKIAFESAIANLAQTVRQVRILFNDLEQAKAVFTTKTIALHKAQNDYNRRTDLVKIGGLSKEDLSHAEDMVSSANQDLVSASQQLQSREAAVKNTTVKTHPLVKAAIAQLKQAYLAKQRTILVAPISGYVAKRNVQVGQYVSQNSTLMAVVALDKVWVEANFKETQLSDMRIGQTVQLTSDLYGNDVVFHGKVANLGIGTGSAFSILPAQNATGNWIKVVQRLPIRIELDKQELVSHPLRIGLSMMVDVETKQTNGLLLSQHSSQQARYTTNVYSHSLDGIEPLIDQIISANDATTQRYLAKNK